MPNSFSFLTREAPSNEAGTADDAARTIKKSEKFHVKDVFRTQPRFQVFQSNSANVQFHMKQVQIYLLYMIIYVYFILCFMMYVCSSVQT